jgi:hypothetical protein
MVHRVLMVTVGKMGMVCRGFVFCGLLMVPGRVFVMFCCLVMVFCCLLRH